MLDIEKDGQKQDDISTNSNSENDFKELDNEIDKVVRGEASFEEEKIDYNSEDDSNLKKNKLQNSSKFTMKNDENKNLEKNNNLDETKLLNYLCQAQENILALEQYKKSLILSLINKEKAQFNNNNNTNFKNNITKNPNFNSNINLNINNNISQNDLRNIMNNSYYYNNMNNIEINNNQINNNINQNMNYMNNSYLNELISLYNYNFNKCTDNNKNDLNNYNIKSCIYNNYNNQEAQENILINNNKLNYMNILNNNYDSLLPINLRMNLFNNNYFNLNEANSNLFLLNQINNKNNLNININNNQQLNNISNLDNHSQMDFNFFSINNNNENIPNKNNNLNSLLNINNINKTQRIKSNKNINGENHTSNKKKINNQKTELDINKNIINLSEVFLCKDKRTTLMIKNIPNKYTISSFLEEININFKFTYDIFYLPIDYVNKCNLGFAFINFVEPFHIILFYELYRGKKWKKFNSDKLCELLYAKFQGKKELIAHFEKGKVLSMTSEEKRPLILPTPNPLPKIKLPIYYFDLFIKIYPNISYEIKECKNKKSNNNGNKKNNYSMIPIFSIKGNFNEN